MTGRSVRSSWVARGGAVLGLALLLCLLAAGNAWAHAGLTLSEPAAGAALGDTPTGIRLTFSEQPQASLSSIRVLDASGRPQQVGRVEPVSGDHLSIVARVGRLARGVYTVSWRVVSAVDGHASGGAYAFGVGVTPPAAGAVETSTTATASRLEMVARWVFLIGLVALLGAGVASVARFGGGDLRLAAGGLVLSALGLALLAEAQRRTAHTSLGALLHTPVGQALLRRGAAIVAAGVALFLAHRFQGWRRRAAMAGVALAAVAAMVIHVAAGHAASAPWPHTLSVALQSVHFAAAGIWAGGLAALLVGLRGAPTSAKTVAVRRFALVAAGGVVVLAATGVARAVEELTSWHDLVSTGYGAAVVVKVVLLLAIVVFAAANRLRGMPAAAQNLRPVRRLAGAELVLAALVLAAAAVLGSLAPPAAGRLAKPLGISVSGSDPGSTVLVRLDAASADPGSNRFVVHIVGARSHQPVPTGHVTLRFRPLDDPGVASTALELARAPGYGAYAGSGANMVFDGRWGVTVVIQRPHGVVRVPLELDTRSPPQFVSVEQAPGGNTKYTVEVGDTGFVRITPDPERAGPSTLFIDTYDIFGDVLHPRQLVLTVAAGDGPARQHPVRRVGGRRLARVTLAKGRNTIAVVARTAQGARLRAVLQLDVPS